MPHTQSSGAALVIHGLKSSGGYAKIASSYPIHSKICNRPRKSHVKLEALRLESYLYALPSVQERVVFGLEESRIEKIIRMEKYLKDMEELIQGKR
jgi:hypothetical protein